jgi:protein associated with RNAse G/E
MNEYRKFGENSVIRGIVNNKIWIAQSVIVVKDTQKETILLLQPGAQCAIPNKYWRWKRNREAGQGSRWEVSKRDQIVLKDYIWHTNRILMFLEPEKFYSCMLFWDQKTDVFNCYYINFQLPYRRSQCGFDTLDLDLDIVIDDKYNWKWKDEDEYQEGIREGEIQSEWVKKIEESKFDVFNRISTRSHPLDGSWLSWRPDPAWLAPKLPKGWEVL